MLDSLIEICYLNQVAANNKWIASRKTLKKVLDKRNEIWYSNKAPPMRRVPCKLNNVTKRKHQTDASKLSLEEPKVASSTGLSQLPGCVTIKNEAMINSSIKD